MTVEVFPFRENQIYTPFLQLILSKPKIYTWWFFFFSRLKCKSCRCPDIHRHFNCPCKANGTPDQVDFSLNFFISLKVPKSTRSEDPFFFPVLFSFLCVYEMLAPTLGLFSIENVLNLHAPLHCTAVHNFRQKRVLIICPIPVMFYTKLYDIIRISGWQGAFPHKCKVR